MSVKEEQSPSTHCNTVTCGGGLHNAEYRDVVTDDVLGTLGLTDGSESDGLLLTSDSAYGGPDVAYPGTSDGHDMTSNHGFLSTSGATYGGPDVSSSLGTSCAAYEHDAASSHDSLSPSGSVHGHDVASCHDSIGSSSGGAYGHGVASFNRDSLGTSHGRCRHAIASNCDVLGTSDCISDTAHLYDVGQNTLPNAMGAPDGHGDDAAPDDPVLLERLDELLQPEQMSSCTSQLSSCVDDVLFSSLNEVNEDLPHLIMDSWVLDEYDDIDPSCIDDAPPKVMQSGEEEVYLNMKPHPEVGMPYPREVDTSSTASGDGVNSYGDVMLLNEEEKEESVSQIFAQWLDSNSHAISLEDLRKIKLKTSTIEDAMRRLGGGKKGLMLFVKCILMWIQNFHVNSACNSSCGDSNDNNSTTGCVGGSMELPDEVPSNLISFLGGITTPYDELDRHDRIGSQLPSCYNLDTIFNMDSCMMMLSSHMSGQMMASSMASLQEGCTTTSCCSSTSSSSANTEHVNNNPFSDKAWNGIQHEAFLCSDNIDGSTPWGVAASMSSSSDVVQDGEHLGNSRSVFENADMMTTMMQQQQQTNQTLSPTQQQKGLHGDFSATRAARKSRMERQRWSVRTGIRSRKSRSVSSLEREYGGQCFNARRRRRQHPTISSVYDDLYDLPTLACGGHHGNLTSRCTQAIMEGKSVNLRRPITQSDTDPEHHQSKVVEKELKLLFHKELKQSDVGNLGRIVLPKKYAESCLPYLEFRDGVDLAIEDFSSPKIWSMTYRFWPNNKSRMYLIENTGDFVKSYKLREGDYMLLYFNLQSNRYVMLGAKAGIEELLRGGLPTNLADSSFGPCLLEDDDDEDDPLLVELIEQTLENLQDSPGEDTRPLK